MHRYEVCITRNSYENDQILVELGRDDSRRMGIRVSERERKRNSIIGERQHQQRHLAQSSIKPKLFSLAWPLFAHYYIFACSSRSRIVITCLNRNNISNVVLSFVGQRPGANSKQNIAQLVLLCLPQSGTGNSCIIIGHIMRRRPLKKTKEVKAPEVAKIIQSNKSLQATDRL